MGNEISVFFSAGELFRLLLEHMWVQRRTPPRCLQSCDILFCTLKKCDIARDITSHQRSIHWRWTLRTTGLTHHVLQPSSGCYSHLCKKGNIPSLGPSTREVIDQHSHWLAKLTWAGWTSQQLCYSFLQCWHGCSVLIHKHLEITVRNSWLTGISSHHSCWLCASIRSDWAWKDHDMIAVVLSWPWEDETHRAPMKVAEWHVAWRATGQRAGKVP